MKKLNGALKGNVARIGIVPFTWKPIVINCDREYCEERETERELIY